MLFYATATKIPERCKRAPAGWRRHQSASQGGRAACLQSAPPGLASRGDARQPHAAEQPGRRSPSVPTSGASVRVLPARGVPATDVRPGVPPGPWEHPPRGRRCAYSRPPCLPVPGFPVRTSVSVQSAIVGCTAVDCMHTHPCGVWAQVWWRGVKTSVRHRTCAWREAAAEQCSRSASPWYPPRHLVRIWAQPHWCRSAALVRGHRRVARYAPL